VFSKVLSPFKVVRVILRELILTPAELRVIVVNFLESTSMPIKKLLLRLNIKIHLLSIRVKEVASGS
jgi:hypothetical protein